MVAMRMEQPYYNCIGDELENLLGLVQRPAYVNTLGHVPYLLYCSSEALYCILNCPFAMVELTERDNDR